ncbi:MAG: dihydroorotase family protein, partial [Deltaproteobacteria bacterium]|nr:dihydroorotase family protein [Deltaproteobacteria bacterium]
MSSKLDLLVKGDVVLQFEVAKNSSVGIKNGLIVGLYGSRDLPEAEEIVDAQGCLIFPGVVDAHVHSYSYPEEGFEHSTRAAAAGGVTTIVEMPYDDAGKLTSPERFEKKVDLIRQHATVDVALLGTVEKDGNTDNIASLVEMGICGFKLSVNEADPVRFPKIEDGVLMNVLPVIARHGVPVGFHAENDDIIKRRIAQFIKQKKTDPKAHCESRPPVSETLPVLQLCELAFWTGVHLHFYHISVPRSVHLIEHYRDAGVDITLETCPHYLVLNEEDMDRLKAFAKINPPVRKREDQEELWELLNCGLIDIVSSDHAPWPLSRKQAANIFENSSGAPGVETMLALLYSEGVDKRNISPVLLAQVLSEAPARRFLLYPRKGHIALGADADLAIIDPSASWRLHAADLQSSVGWTPYEG